MWGTMFWEYMQETNGAHSLGHGNQGLFAFHDLQNDPTRFGTEVLDPRSASFASGMFMHMARLIKPYNAARSQELQKHAEMAFAAAGDAVRPTHKLYYAVQKYLLTGDEAAHQMVKDLSPNAGGYANNYNGAPESFACNGWLASFFYSYIVAKDRPTDPAVVDRFKAAIKAAADKEIGYLAANAYPVGTPANLRWWGSNTAQGQYAYPCLLQWSLTKEQKYIDAVSQLMDYAQGLNPLGKCYMTGTGFNRVHNPHDRESAYTKRRAGAAPGDSGLRSRRQRAGACRFPLSAASPANAGTSTIWAPFSGASLPSIRASVSPPPSIRCWPKAENTTPRRSVHPGTKVIKTHEKPTQEHNAAKMDLSPRPVAGSGRCRPRGIERPNAGHLLGGRGGRRRHAPRHAGRPGH